MKAKDIDLIRVLSGIEYPDHKKDYGYDDADEDALVDVEVVGDALEGVASRRPVQSIEDTLREHSPLKGRKKQFKGRLHVLEEKVAFLQEEVAYLRDQLGLQVHRRVTPADMVDDWDQTLHGGLALGGDPLSGLSTLHKNRTRSCSAEKRVIAAPMSARPEDLFEEEDIPLILTASEARPDPPAAPKVTTAGRFSGLDLDDEIVPEKIKKEAAHPRFSGLGLED